MDRLSETVTPNQGYVHFLGCETQFQGRARSFRLNDMITIYLLRTYRISVFFCNGL